LTEALARLSPAQRAAIVLRYYLDWSVEDTAKALRKRPGTVTALTHQGMTRLRELLVEEPLDE
jgi:DNA-directed RNA polymerase specialized sigma24 family protein